MVNNGEINNQEQEDFNFLDAVTITSFLAQLSNIEKDEKQTKWIHGVIQTLAKEVQKLHEENDILIKKVNDILIILEGDYNNDTNE